MEPELTGIEEAIKDLRERDDLDADTKYIFRKFRNAKLDEIVVLCTNHKFEEARECANRFNNAYLPDELEKVIDHLLWQINDYERMITGEYYDQDYSTGKEGMMLGKAKLVRKKDKAPTRKLRRAPKRKRGRQ